MEYDWQTGDAYILNDKLYIIEEANFKVSKAYTVYRVLDHENQETFLVRSFTLANFQKLSEEEKAYYLFSL